MEVTELPIGVWTDNNKEYLESILIDTYKSTSEKKKGKTDKSPRRDKGITVISKQFIKSFENSTETDVRFALKMKPTILNQLKNKTHKDTNMTYLEKRLGLTSMKNITNILYNEKDQICKFTNALILSNISKLRLDLYVKRKNHGSTITKRT